MLTILFDLDDTLYDTASPFFRVLANYRLENSHSEEATFALFRKHCDAAFDLFSNGDLTLAESHIMRTQHTFADLGLPLTAEEAMHFQETYQKRQAEITLSPGIEQLLNELKSRHIPIAVFTNGPEKHQMKKFNALGLERWVPPARIFISETIGFPKPHAEAFTHVQKALKANPDELLFIGDTYETDIIGGQTAGWTSLWFNHRRKPEDEKVVLEPIFYSVAEMHQAIHDNISKRKEM
ncbi:putative hydrolase of the HAD superfamily [Trichococcus patagoniensis]|uniref:Putative hydrolase of the HAD superfamily n=1 Tax=Trichococcus patagoniensis TaxID=382641 RepID=A0A2T5IRF0_9LACT|nr:HAD family hydrolase [Trichococcus patagoniensis]PTQ86370.1 putative hydrolase of the HAD superfamily [Trichococcus patagoniensis]